MTTSAESSGNHRTGRRRIPARRAREAIAVAGLALLATSATAPAMPMKVPENPLKTVESPPRGRVPEVGPPRVPQPVGLDATVATIPVTFTGEIPATLLDAYRRASDTVGLAQPGCHLPMELLAAIGKVETNHARGGQVDADGTTSHPILGPVLDGNGFAAIPDTDGGLLDGDTAWDRAVGPMQFLPGTWQRWQADGNGDHRADPNNVYDASLAAGRYLCASDRDLATPQGLDGAILSYNSSASYRNLVLGWLAAYTKGTVVVPDDVGGPVPAVLPLPAPAEPTQPAAQVPPTTPAPSPPPTSTPPPTGEPTPPPAGEPAPPVPVPVTPPPQPAAPACETGDVLGGIVTGIVGGLLGPIIGAPEQPPCSDIDSTGATTCSPGTQPATTEGTTCQ